MTTQAPEFIPIALYAARRSAETTARILASAQARIRETEDNYNTASDPIFASIITAARAIVDEIERTQGEANEAAIDAQYLPGTAAQHATRAQAAEEYAHHLSMHAITLDTLIWQLHETDHSRPRSMYTR